MKNKKNIRILLPLVILIWGAVMYQFFTFSKSDQENVAIQEPVVKPLMFKKREPITINVNYRDPFLGKVYVTKINKNSNHIFKKVAKTVKPIPDKIESIVWPTISYKGIVSDAKSKNKVFMLIIDGRTFLMRASNKENGVYLVEGDRESVEMEYKNESKIILIEE
ncbi:hypothetical protein [Flavobacterium sp. H122]|uniref:hypothetical protein n=1 Tax=Flavobacterium sp. H122 TaxID=2529860 RepID=UPI0010AA2CB4|nr:hypothetical protein [Flavobacterium sp. H122]